MGNKLCKKKSDCPDNPKMSTPFDRIINRLHLRPSSWKSDSHLNQKQVNRTIPKDQQCQKENVKQTQLLSKSSDWTDTPLEVPDKDEPIHLRNPKLSLIFDNNSSTPTPPPRKHKKGFREKIEALAKTSLQGFQSKKPVEEPLCVKKTINQTCPLDDHDCAIHNRNHKHPKTKEIKKTEAKLPERRKNPSVVSLPEYNDLKLSIANEIDQTPNSEHNSLVISPNENKKLSSTASTGKLETCMTRCRSFGSLLPQQLLDKLRVKKVPIDVESDDSFGGLEDWDLRIIEHYNPKDTSLPRQVKPPRNEKDLLSDVESLIVKDEEEPKPPARRSESLLKKINREASESAIERRVQENNVERAVSTTPPPSPERRPEETVNLISANHLPTEEDGHVEHSSLMKILEEFSIKNKQESINNVDRVGKAELKKQISMVEDFINNEKMHGNCDKVFNETRRIGKLKS